MTAFHHLTSVWMTLTLTTRTHRWCFDWLCDMCECQICYSYARWFNVKNLCALGRATLLASCLNPWNAIIQNSPIVIMSFTKVSYEPHHIWCHSSHLQYTNMQYTIFIPPLPFIYLYTRAMVWRQDNQFAHLTQVWLDSCSNAIREAVNYSYRYNLWVVLVTLCKESYCFNRRINE